MLGRHCCVNRPRGDGVTSPRNLPWTRLAKSGQFVCIIWPSGTTVFFNTTFPTLNLDSTLYQRLTESCYKEMSHWLSVLVAVCFVAFAWRRFLPAMAGGPSTSSAVQQMDVDQAVVTAPADAEIAAAAATVEADIAQLDADEAADAASKDASIAALRAELAQAREDNRHLHGVLARETSDAALAEMVDAEGTITDLPGRTDAAPVTPVAVRAPAPTSTALTPSGSFRLKPPQEFSGSATDLHVRDWLDIVMAFMIASMVPAGKWAMMATTLLRGDALNAWMVFLGASHGVANVALATWAEFEETLMSAFGFDERGLTAHSKLAKLQQMGTAAAYTREFKALCARIKTPACLSETDKIFRYRSGLKRALASRSVVRPDGTPWATLAELAEFVVRQDELFMADAAAGRPAEQGASRGVTARSSQEGRSGPRGEAEPRSWRTAAQRGAATEASRASRRALAATSRPTKVVAPAVQMDPRLGITIKEKRRRMTGGLCLKCGKPGHRIAQCPTAER